MVVQQSLAIHWLALTGSNYVLSRLCWRGYKSIDSLTRVYFVKDSIMILDINVVEVDVAKEAKHIDDCEKDKNPEVAKAPCWVSLDQANNGGSNN